MSEFGCKVQTRWTKHAIARAKLKGRWLARKLKIDREERDALVLDLRAEVADAHKKIEFLWSIIDDIDSYGDLAKGDDKLFRGLVERRQKDRWKTGITTDGYTLNINGANDGNPN